MTEHKNPKHDGRMYATFRIDLRSVAQLAPMFAQIERLNVAGEEPGAIFAQVFHDGIDVVWLPPADLIRVRRALGLTGTSYRRNCK